MRYESGRVLSILLAVVTATAAIEGFVLVGLSRRVSEIETRVPPSVAGVPVTPAALGGEVKGLTDWRPVVDGERAAIKADVREVSKRLERLETAVADRPAGSAPPDAALKATVAKLVDEKIAALPKGGGGEWKPALEELTARLDLTEFQETTTKRILDDAKHELFLLASIKRSDGTAKIDDLVAAITDPVDPQEATQKWFISLFSEKIPGRDEAYIAEILRIRGRAENGLVEALDPAQATRLKQLNLDYLGVNTGYDPFAEYVQEAMR